MQWRRLLPRLCCICTSPTSTRCGLVRSQRVPKSHDLLQDMVWGEREGQLIDPFGHKWGLTQHVRDVPHEEKARAVAEMFGM